MPSLGELFIELGVVGDVKPLENAISKMKEAVKVIDDEVNANQRLLKYLQDIKNARTDSEKTLIKQNFAKEFQKQKMLDEIDKNQKAIDGKKKLAKNIAGVVKGVTGFVTALVGAGIALNKFTNDLVASNQTMLDLTRTTDIALETFQKWDGIGKMLGVENAAQQLEGLNQRIFELMLTGQGAKGFQIAGINPVGQDAEGVLEQLRDRVSGMSDTAATYLLREMGLDPKMLHLLRMRREEFESLQAEIKKYRLTDDQTKQIQKMNIQLQIAGIKLKYLKDRAVLALMPYGVKFVESLARVAEMLARAGKKVADFVIKWRGLIGIFAIGLSKLKPVQAFFEGLKTKLTGADSIIGKLIAKVPILGRVFTALGGVFAKALLPLTALYLILDDIAGYMQGKNSLIGEVINWFQETGGDFSKIFGKMFGGDFMGGLKELLIKLIDIIDDVVMIILRIGEILTGLPLTKWGKDFANWVSGGNYDKLKNYEYGQNNSTEEPIKEPIIVDYSVGDMSSQFVTPTMQRYFSDNRVNTTTTTDNRKISMTNYIQTNQTGTDIQNQLAYARNAMAAGWA